MDRQRKLIWRKKQEDHGSATGGRPICMQEHNRLAIRGCRMMSSLTLIMARQEEAAGCRMHDVDGQQEAPRVRTIHEQGSCLLVSATLLRKERCSWCRRCFYGKKKNAVSHTYTTYNDQVKTYLRNDINHDYIIVLNNKNK